MKENIINYINKFAIDNDNIGLIHNIWRTPIVRFGKVTEGDFKILRDIVHPEHIMPWEILEDAKIIIAYFFPFTEKIVNSNKGGHLSSREWAMAYEKTNASFMGLNRGLISLLHENGYGAAVTPEAFQYDETLLKSRWSQRHIAKICGLGTFGINNMLITEEGCCGRIGTIVTNLKIETDKSLKKENCLFKHDGTCGACVIQCPSKALTKEKFDRFTCYALCQENAEVHEDFGSSYAVTGADHSTEGSYVCGKCVVGVTCSFRRP